jgi:hypothetical protein
MLKTKEDIPSLPEQLTFSLLEKERNYLSLYQLEEE